LIIILLSDILKKPLVSEQHQKKINFKKVLTKISKRVKIIKLLLTTTKKRQKQSDKGKTSKEIDISDKADYGH